MLTKDEYKVLRMYALGAYNRGRRGNLIPYGLDEEDFVQECLLSAVKNAAKAEIYASFDQFFRQIVKYSLKSLSQSQHIESDKLRRTGMESYRRWSRIVNPDVSLSGGGGSHDGEDTTGDDYLDLLVSLNGSITQDKTNSDELIEFIATSKSIDTRAKEMLVLYSGGFTLDEIGLKYSISKQRVKTIIDTATTALHMEHKQSMDRIDK